MDSSLQLQVERKQTQECLEMAHGTPTKSLTDLQITEMIELSQKRGSEDRIIRQQEVPLIGKFPSKNESGFSSID